MAHWAHVLENGLRPANVTGADIEIVQLFAVFHDPKRVKETSDPDHGRFRVEFAAELRGQVFDLSDHAFNLLYRACSGHTTHERTHPDITIQTCWNADRLDLWRVGVTPHPSPRCTDAAKDPAMLKWSDGRASFGIVPSFVMKEWGTTWPRSEALYERLPSFHHRPQQSPSGQFPVAATEAPDRGPGR